MVNKRCYIGVRVKKSEKICRFFYEDGSRGRIDAELCNEQEFRRKALKKSGYPF
jgi:hypothetical protein